MFGPEIETIGAYEGIYRRGRCTIERRAAAGGEDIYGQPLRTWGQVAAGVPVRIRQTAARVAVDTERSAVVVDARASFDPGQDVRPGDHLVDITDDHGRPHLAGRWAVSAIVDRVSHLEAILEASDGSTH